MKQVLVRAESRIVPFGGVLHPCPGQSSAPGYTLSCLGRLILGKATERQHVKETKRYSDLLSCH